MDSDTLQARLDAQEKKLDAIFISVEKARRYFLALLIFSIVAFVLPLIGAFFVIPSALESYTSSFGL